MFKFDILKRNVGVPTADDWENARRMMTFLSYFYELINRISGSFYVTCNTFFHDIYKIHRLLDVWMKDDDLELATMARKIKLKYDKYWGGS